MNQGLSFTSESVPFVIRQTAKREFILVDMAEVAAPRSFRESTGKTPYQFLLDRRAQRAQILMRDPRASLTEVARSSGFANQHHMARIFLSVTGMTPSAYRGSL
jgi:AraC-like DNA-binding protein